MAARARTRTTRETDIVRACWRDARPLPEPRHHGLGWPAARPRRRAAARQVDAVNGFVNRWQYRADADNYGRSDYWATPLEFFRRSGDCEDYVIAKYRSLRLLGLPAEQLRMVVVQDVVRDLPHAVLAVYLGDEVLILDNLSEAVLPQRRVVDYVPYYSVNEAARWAHTPPATLVVAGAHRRRTAGTDPSR